jgi:hypothetical protein
MVSVPIEMASGSPAQAESNALMSMLTEFSGVGTDTRKLDYLKNRYAGFGQREAAKLSGVTLPTVNKWRKDDPRVAHYDDEVTTGSRKELRKEVLQGEWFRNFWLVLKRDQYILSKVHGLLNEPYLEVTADGHHIRKMGSPSMRKEDWEYFSQMRKMYTPDAWASIEKVIGGGSGQFDIAQFVLNMANNQIIVQAPTNGEA